jgi:hypothetical protein
MDLDEPLSHRFDEGGLVIICEGQIIRPSVLYLCVDSIEDILDLIAKTLFE